MKLRSLVWASFAAALLSACGGGGGGEQAASPTPPPVATPLVGVLIDSPVAGISYRTPTQSGTTNAAGQFNYLAGESVTFSLGSVQFPPVPANATVTALDIARTVDPNNQLAVNILVLLQSLDSDGNPANGITIPATAAAAATAAIDFDVAPTAFALSPAVLNLVANSGSSNRTPVTVEAALAHFQATLNGGNGGTRINVAPLADAGANQSARTGDTIAFNGAGSRDANGDTLTYAWTLSVRPAASTATLANADTVNPALVLDVPGIYTASLVVRDGALSSTAATVTITASVLNIPPVANAGTAQNVVTGSTVNLSGAASSDANGDTISYAWSFASRPAGSTASLTGANTVNPSFVPDVAGSYELSLTVSDGEFTSITPSTVTISATPANVAPVANAGPNQDVTIALGTAVNLDGSASRDANGDALSYSWAFVSRPAGSSAALVRADSVNPSFTPDRFGAYVIGLTASDGRLNSAVASVTVNVFELNAPPVANAGTAQNVATGSTVTLSGAGSADANGDALTYAWTLVSKPAGSGATLSGASTVNPSFVADMPGAYVFSLVVNDGQASSTNTANVTISVFTPNAPPVANAGATQNVATGSTVTLSGASSTDANGDTLSYAWNFVSRPTGSRATLSGGATVNPSFVADVAGAYVVGLVVNDGQANSSNTANVTINVFTPNAPPVANAGAAQNVATGSTVTLSGAGSTDANGDALTYAWTFVSKPAGSAAALSGATTVNPGFVADVAGTYVFSLVVNDGQASSTNTANVTVSVFTPNAPPVANAGTTQNVATGSTVTLSGAGSTDANGDTLSYAWSFVSRPAGSGATISGGTTATPSFVADVAGAYVVGLVVNDGQANSSNTANVTINVFTPNAPPVANAGTAQNVATGATATLSGAGSTDANGDALSYAWTLVSRPTGSAAVLTGANTVNPSFVADTAGAYVFSLVVNDGQASSTNAANVTVTAITYPSLSLAASATVTSGGFAGVGQNDLPVPSNTGVTYVGEAKTFGPFRVTGLAGPTTVSTFGTLAAYSTVRVNGGSPTSSATVNNGDLLSLDVDLAGFARDNGPLGYGQLLQPRLRVGSAVTITFGSSGGGGILLCTDPTLPPSVGNRVCP
jgi:hypothetical protein